jgi:Tol biopolymer transport system component
MQPMPHYLISLTLIAACRINGHYDGIDAGNDSDIGTGDGNVSCRLRVTFEDGVDGAREVWVANPDGSGLVDVSNSAADDRRPSWAPDGKSLLFETNRNGHFDIYFVNADGSGLRNLTEGSTSDDMGGVWSPDGHKIAFIRGLAAWTMNADGSGAVPVSSMTTTTQVTWSNDGSRIVFENKPSGTALPAVHAAVVGSSANPIRLSPVSTFAEESSAAPVEKALFAADSNIYTVKPDGSDFLMLTTFGTDRSPQWADDGQTIIFTSRRSGRFGVWKMLANGTMPMQLTINSDPIANVRDFVTDVSADGQLIAFRRVTQQPNMSEIGVIGIDGTGIQIFSSGAKNAFAAKFGACP